MENCSKCSGPTKGWKCDVCGSVSENHVADHQCGGDHCMPMCEKCREAQVLCSC